MKADNKNIKRCIAILLQTIEERGLPDGVSFGLYYYKTDNLVSIDCLDGEALSVRVEIGDTQDVPDPLPGQSADIIPFPEPA